MYSAPCQAQALKTPSYWSASQLLPEHEMRKHEQEEYRQIVTHTLGAIHENYPEEYPNVTIYDPFSNYGHYLEQSD